MAVGTTIGAVAGSRLLRKLSNSSTRILFLVVVLYIMVQMIVRGVIG